MRFKSPGGNLVWLTPLLTIAGGWMAYDYYRKEWFGLAVFYGVLAVLAALTWLDQKWVAYPLLLFFSFAVVGWAILLYTNGFSWRGLWKIVIAGYAIYDLWEWRGRANVFESETDASPGENRTVFDILNIEQAEPSDALRRMLDEHNIPAAGRQALFENLMAEPLHLAVLLFPEDGVRGCNGADFCDLCLRDGYVAIGSAANGDLVAMDLTRRVGEIGYVSHESMWQAARIRDVYHPVAGSLSEFIALLASDRMPTDYHHAREMFPARK